MAGTAVVASGNYVVEIDTGFIQDAFLLDGTTDFASVLDGVNSISVRRGRRDQGDQFSAGTMSFTMLDTAGIFNPFDTQSPYYDTPL